jgi:hypothetical protein
VKPRCVCRRSQARYSGSTVAVSRSRKAECLFQQEKATSIGAGKGYTPWNRSKSV